VCRLDATGTLCTGCWRTLDEITAWRDLDNDARLAVLDAGKTRQPGRAGRRIVLDRSGLLRVLVGKG
jgi:predicted Fe-S protein YdhL (DUF1289 family)